MKLPRGLKKVFKSTSPVRLSGSGKYRGFELLKHGKPTNIKFPGLTKRLDSVVFSNGVFPSFALRGNERKIGWKGKSGGRKRGSAVDAQLTRCINSGKITPQKGHYSLTKLVLLTLFESGLVPVVAQRGCCSVQNRVATAADIVCYNSKTNQISIVELKCGFSGSRSTSAQISGTACNMQVPLEKAPDCILNRHFAQLAVTSHLIEKETETLEKLSNIGINVENIEASLLYVNEERCDLVSLPEWWRRKAPKILQTLK